MKSSKIVSGQWSSHNSIRQPEIWIKYSWGPTTEQPEQTQQTEPSELREQLENENMSEEESHICEATTKPPRIVTHLEMHPNSSASWYCQFFELSSLVFIKRDLNKQNIHYESTSENSRTSQQPMKT